MTAKIEQCFAARSGDQAVLMFSAEEKTSGWKAHAPSKCQGRRWETREKGRTLRHQEISLEGRLLKISNRLGEDTGCAEFQNPDSPKGAIKASAWSWLPCDGIRPLVRRAGATTTFPVPLDHSQAKK